MDRQYPRIQATSLLFFLGLTIVIIGLCGCKPGTTKQTAGGVETAGYVVYASPDGTGEGQTHDKPTTLQRAIDLVAKTGGKVVALKGVYRQNIRVPPGVAPMIIESEQMGDAVVSGLDIIDGICLKEAAIDGLFSIKLPWTLSKTMPDYDGWWSSISRRRELLTVNGVFLKQQTRSNDVYINKYAAIKSSSDWRDLIKKIKEEGDAALSPTELKNGEFTINTEEQKIYLRLTNEARPFVNLEVGYARSNQKYENLFNAQGRSCLTLRGLTIQGHSSPDFWTPALHIGGYEKERAHSIVLDNVRVISNNGRGVDISCADDVIVQNCTFNWNGNGGGSAHSTINLSAINSTFSWNNWRGGEGNSTHEGGGIKLFDHRDPSVIQSVYSENTTFVNCTFIGNGGTGLYFCGYGGTQTVQKCLLEGNGEKGINFLETTGPSLVEECLIKNNGVGIVVGGQFIAIKNTEIDNPNPLALVANGKARELDILFIGDLGQATKMGVSSAIHGFSMRDCLVKGQPKTSVPTGTKNTARVERIENAMYVTQGLHNKKTSVEKWCNRFGLYELWRRGAIKMASWSRKTTPIIHFVENMFWDSAGTGDYIKEVGIIPNRDMLRITNEETSTIIPILSEENIVFTQKEIIATNPFLIPLKIEIYPSTYPLNPKLRVGIDFTVPPTSTITIPNQILQKFDAVKNRKRLSFWQEDRSFQVFVQDGECLFPLKTISQQTLDEWDRKADEERLRKAGYRK